MTPKLKKPILLRKQNISPFVPTSVHLSFCTAALVDGTEKKQTPLLQQIDVREASREIFPWEHFDIMDFILIETTYRIIEDKV